jgi:hypothetical protein
MGVITGGRPAAAQRSGWTDEPTRQRARRRRAVVGIAVLALLAGAGYLVQAHVPALLASWASPGGPAPSLAATRFTSLGEPVRIPVAAASRVTVTAPPARGSARVDGTAVVYTPRPEHIGQDQLSLSACNRERCSTATVQVRTGRPGLSALSSVVATSVVRRADQPLRPGTRISGSVPPGTAAAAVSVTVTRAGRPGRVTVDGGAGPVTALSIARAGSTTTNLVIVPVRGTALTVATEPGGGLTVDVVGTFTTADAARGGRFVPVKQTNVVSLYTKQDGRDATVDPASFGAKAGIRAVLAVVTAEIGTKPAWVDLGGEPGQIDRTMSWGPASGSNQRRALALIPVNDRGQFSLRYEHGSRIDVDVLGYFTGEAAADSVAGLYVPRTPATVFDGVARPQGNQVEAPAAAAAVFVNLSGEKGVEGRLPAQDVGIASGRTIGTTLPATGGKTEIRASRSLSVQATLLGYFVAAQP